MYSPKCIRNVSGCRFASRWYFWPSRRHSLLKSTKNGKGGNIFGQTRRGGKSRKILNCMHSVSGAMQRASSGSYLIPFPSCASALGSLLPSRMLAHELLRLHAQLLDGLLHVAGGVHEQELPLLVGELVGLLDRHVVGAREEIGASLGRHHLGLHLKGECAQLTSMAPKRLGRRANSFVTGLTVTNMSGANSCLSCAQLLRDWPGSDEHVWSKARNSTGRFPSQFTCWNALSKSARTTAWFAHAQDGMSVIMVLRVSADDWTVL